MWICLKFQNMQNISERHLGSDIPPHKEEASIDEK